MMIQDWTRWDGSNKAIHGILMTTPGAGFGVNMVGNPQILKNMVNL